MCDPLVATARRAPTRRRSHAGQALTEFAVVAPLLLLLVTAMLEFSRHYYSRLSVRHTVVEAARFGSTGQRLDDPDTGIPMTRAESIAHIIENGARRLPVLIESIALDPSDGGQPGDLVRIEARFRFSFLLAPIIQSFAPASIAFTVATTVKNEPRF
jgi:hypothetical protein